MTAQAGRGPWATPLAQEATWTQGAPERHPRKSPQDPTFSLVGLPLGTAMLRGSKPPQATGESLAPEHHLRHLPGEPLLTVSSLSPDTGRGPSGHLPCLLPPQCATDAGPEAQQGAAASCGPTAEGQAEAGPQTRVRCPAQGPSLCGAAPRSHHWDTAGAVASGERAWVHLCFPGLLCVRPRTPCGQTARVQAAAQLRVSAAAAGTKAVSSDVPGGPSPARARERAAPGEQTGGTQRGAIPWVGRVAAQCSWAGLKGWVHSETSRKTVEAPW